MSRVTADMVQHRMVALRTIVGCPAEYMIDGVIQVGYIGAEHSREYGGWRLYKLTTAGGGETANVYGFSGRFPTPAFHAMLGVAIACLNRKETHDGF